MVLQRNVNARVWGFGGYGASQVKCTLSANGNASVGTALGSVNPTSGLWTVDLPPQPGSPTPFSLTCSCDAPHANPVSLSQLLFGDVFLCAGSSNMQLSLAALQNANLVIQQANNYHSLRLLSLSPSLLQPWSIASSSSVNGGNWSFFSAACWSFAVSLFHLPSWPSTPLGLVAVTAHDAFLPAWMSPDVASRCPGLPPSGAPPNLPSSLFNALLSPLLNMALTSFLWYQGEQDVAMSPLPALYYACAAPLMVRDWRAKWYNPTLKTSSAPLATPAFLYVQLAAYTEGGPYQDRLWQFRLAQQQLLAAIPNSCMATAVDLGDFKSPFGNMYPRLKIPVGTRLSACAAHLIYGQSVTFRGPQPTKAIYTASSGVLTIYFDPSSLVGGMNFVSAAGCPQEGACAEWQLVGPNSQLAIPTDIQIAGNTVLMMSPFGKNTVAVRYGASDWPLCTLYNTDGFPATPMNLTIIIS